MSGVLVKSSSGHISRAISARTGADPDPSTQVTTVRNRHAVQCGPPTRCPLPSLHPARPRGRLFFSRVGVGFVFFPLGGGQRGLQPAPAPATLGITKSLTVTGLVTWECVCVHAQGYVACRQ